MPSIEKTGFGLAHCGSYSFLPLSITFEAESCWVLWMPPHSVENARSGNLRGSRFEVVHTGQSSLTKAHHQSTKSAWPGPAGHPCLWSNRVSCNQWPLLYSQHPDFGIQVICLESLYYSSQNFNWRKSLLFPVTGTCLGQFIIIACAVVMYSLKNIY